MRKAILGLAPLLLAIGSAAAAQAPAWQVSEVSGDVRVVDGGRSRAATRGLLLSSGSTIATAAGARAVLVRGEEYVVVSPSSRLRVPDTAQARGGIIQMLTDWGTALFRIERRATPHFGVQTPYLAAVVKGTVFTVTVGEAGGSVQVTEGAVEVSTIDGGAAEIIRPGMVVSVSAADLMQLNIEGEVERTIRSNGTPSAGVVTIPAAQAGTYEGPSAQTIEITAPVLEQAVSLADSTEGLIDGTLGFELALADVADQSRALVQPAGPDPSDGPPDVPGTDDGQSGAGTPPPSDDGGVTPPPDDGAAPPVDDGGAAPPDDGDAGTPPDNGGTVIPPDDDGTDLPPDDGATPPDDGGTATPPDDGGTDIPPDDGGSTPPDDGDDDGALPPDDGNNGHGNDDDGQDDSNPGGSGGPGGGDSSGPGSGGDDGALPPDDGNNGHGNDDDGQDDGNPGQGGGPGGGHDHGGPGGNPGPGDPPTSPPGDDGGIGVCLPGDLLCVGIGGPGGGDDDGPGDPPTSPPGDDGGIGVCLPGDLLCLGIGGPAGGGGEDEEGRGPGGLCLPLVCRPD